MESEILKVLLSGVVGGCIASVLTHGFSEHRERVKIRLEKLESLLVLITQLNERVLTRHAILFGGPADPLLSAHKAPTFFEWWADDLTERMSCLVMLHFQRLGDNLTAVLEANDHFTTACTECARDAGAMDVTAVERIKDLEQALLDATLALRIQALEEHEILIGRWRKRLWNAFQEKCEGQ